MATGRVKWFEPSRAFGFIVPDEPGPDVFFDAAACPPEGPPPDAAHIEYETIPTPRGPKAVRVRMRPTNTEYRIPTTE